MFLLSLAMLDGVLGCWELKNLDEEQSIHFVTLMSYRRGQGKGGAILTIQLSLSITTPVTPRCLN